MSGAEAALRAARLGDEVVHGFGLLGMVAGALIGVAIGAAIVAAGVATGGLAIVAIVGGCIAGGGLAGGALARGISKAADLPAPTTGMLAMASPPRVTVNSRSALRAGIDFAPSCNGLPMNHPPLVFGPVLIAQGAQLVTVNGMPMARQSMKLVCGAKIKGGSENVTVGGPTATVVAIYDTEEMFEKGLQILGFAALGAAGLGAAAAGFLAFGGFVAVVGASMYGMDKLHEWGESLGPGYGDIMVGVAGFALLGLGARGAKTPAGRNAIDVLNRTEVKVKPNTLGMNGGNIQVKLKPKINQGESVSPQGGSTYKQRLDQTPVNNGSWKGERGESLWKSTDKEVIRHLEEADVDGINYQNAQPDFSPVSKGQVEIPNMTTNRNQNFRAADEALAKEWGVTRKDVKAWREENNYTWHEEPNLTTMQLVPSSVNGKLGHLGGVGELKAGKVKIPTED